MKRLYRPTASRFKDILTSTGKKSTAKYKYLDELIKWTLYGDKDDIKFSNFWTERGKKLESMAKVEYSAIRGLKVKESKFVFNKKFLCGCYPDGIVDNGAIEIKCLKKENYENPAIQIKKHKPQLQGTLLILDIKWIDFVLYFPGLPLYIEKIYRDERYLDLLKNELLLFNNLLEIKLEKEILIK